MGYGNMVPTPQQRKEDQEKWLRHTVAVNAVKERQRLDLADKIVMVVIDKIVSDLIRPGPKPEERECYEMAQELRDMTTELKCLVAQVLNIEKAPTHDP